MSLDRSQLRSFLIEVPKVELHLHLVGSAALDLVADLARRSPSSDVPSNVAELERSFKFSSLQDFIIAYERIANLVRTDDDIRAVLARTTDDLINQTVRYAEITVTPYSHYVNGIPLERVAAALDWARSYAAARGLRLAWIYDIPGYFGAHAARLTLSAALEHPPSGLVGLGLAGRESGVDRADFVDAFRSAREAGLSSVPHAGESDGPASIRAALDDLGASRIGHGIRAVEDPKLMARLAAEGIFLEVCPTSNLRTRVVRRDNDHPLRHLVEAGVKTTINTDDPTIFGTSLVREYEVAAKILGFDIQQIVSLLLNAVEASHLDSLSATQIRTEIQECAQRYGIG